MIKDGGGKVQGVSVVIRLLGGFSCDPVASERYDNSDIIFINYSLSMAMHVAVHVV